MVLCHLRRFSSSLCAGVHVSLFGIHQKRIRGIGRLDRVLPVNEEKHDVEDFIDIHLFPMVAVYQQPGSQRHFPEVELGNFQSEQPQSFLPNTDRIVRTPGKHFAS